ncbi:Carbohydrate sulfotransferase 14 [Amphibalanus amphitrite]|uniref:Carbohydrate sulfotransferase n=1 Tax=Amphibalanus amphitrite TaxID=1232801 RepID=A0A6A4VDX4_AMPAM|nr:Carbohydrate sulfotransferase 14 [Amphibalanus amphitrite]
MKKLWPLSLQALKIAVLLMVVIHVTSKLFVIQKNFSVKPAPPVDQWNATTDHQAVQTDQQMVLADRLTAFRSACRATSEARRPADTLDYVLDHRFLRRTLIYDDKYKLIFCAVPKISSTRWKLLLGTLSGQIPSNKTLHELNKMDVNVHGHVHHILSELPASEARRRLETYTSAVFVRHPLERLVSGYREKYKAENRGRPFIVRTAVQILAHEQNRSTEQVAEEGLPPQVTFEQFARWVADAPPFDPDVSYPPEALNAHWLPVQHHCQPCVVPYSFLGKFETMREDAELLFKMTNITTVSLEDRTRPLFYIGFKFGVVNHKFDLLLERVHI